MPVTYETWLVLLSIVMAIQGAYVGLSLAVQIGAAAGMRRRAAGRRGLLAGHRQIAKSDIAARAAARSRRPV